MQIIRRNQAADGYRVTVVTIGREYNLVFQTKPSDQELTSLLAEFEQQLVDEVTEPYMEFV